MITVDTSALIALVNQRDPRHEEVARVIDEDAGPFIIPAQIMAEIAFMIDRQLGHQSVVHLLENLEASQFILDCGEGDIERIRTLVTRYGGLPLGFADAAVAACAERHRGRVLTLDLRHFGVLARDVRITILP